MIIDKDEVAVTSPDRNVVTQADDQRWLSSLSAWRPLVVVDQTLAAS